MLRLLTLPTDVQEMINDGRLTSGHARNLVGAPNASELASQIVSEKWSVRETETKLRRSKSPKNKDSGTQSHANEDSGEERILEEKLTELLGLKVKIHLTGKEKGAIHVFFDSPADLDSLLQRFTDSYRDI
jgi:ParB family chromosome partitioning protein